MTYYTSSTVNFKILKQKQKTNVKHKNKSKYFLNKNVLSFVSNVATLSAFFTYSGIVLIKMEGNQNTLPVIYLVFVGPEQGYWHCFTDFNH